MGNTQSFFREAILENNVTLVRQLLIAEPELVEFRNYQGFTALCFAAQKGYNELVELLLSFNADIEDSNNLDSASPLVIAVVQNHVSTCRILLRKGANCNIVTKTGKTPLGVATIEGHQEMVDLLLEHKANPEKGFKDGSPLIVAVERNYLCICESLLKAGASSNCVKANGFTALSLAAYYGYEEILELLLAYNADIEGQDGILSPLIHAVQRNQVHTCSILLWRGAKTDYLKKEFDSRLIDSNSDYFQLTSPLLKASVLGHSRIVTLLLEHGAGVHIRNNNSQSTPILLASLEGHTDVVQQLLQYGANWKDQDVFGRHPLHVAAMKNGYGVVELLVRSGCPVDLMVRFT